MRRRRASSNDVRKIAMDVVSAEVYFPGVISGAKTVAAGLGPRLEGVGMARGESDCASYPYNAANTACIPAGYTCATPGHADCGHGTCDLASSPPHCTCEQGYAGVSCCDCASGYETTGTPPACRRPAENCADPNAAYDYCGRGTCDHAPSLPACVCNAGYAGARCTDCAPGWWMTFSDGICHPGCALGNFGCDHHGVCVDSPNGPSCSCSPGFLPADGLHCVRLQGLTCADPQVFDMKTGYAESSTRAGSTSFGSTCAMTAGTDVLSRVLRLSLPSAQRVAFRAVGSAGIAIAIRSECANLSAEFVCAPSTFGGEELETDLPAGDSFVVVQSWDAAPTDFGLCAQVICPPAQVFAWDSQQCVASPCEPNPCTDASLHDCRVDANGAALCLCDPGFEAIDPSNACVPTAGALGTRCAYAILL